MQVWDIQLNFAIFWHSKGRQYSSQIALTLSLFLSVLAEAFQQLLLSSLLLRTSIIHEFPNPTRDAATCVTEKAEDNGPALLVDPRR